MNIYLFGRLFIIAVLLIASGCANVESRRTSLENISSCCTDFSNMPVADITADELAFEIVDTDPVFAFSTGKSHFRKLRFASELQAGARLIIYSSSPHINKFYTSRGSWSARMYPAVTFLDSNNQAISSFDNPDPEIRCEKNGCWAFRVNYPIPAGARFVIVYTNSKNIGREQLRIVPGTSPSYAIPIGKIFVPMGGGEGLGDRSIGFPTGKLQVSIFQ